MSLPPVERSTAIIVIRDRFSTTARCVKTLLANTSEPVDVIVVSGGTPKHFEESLRNEFSDTVRFIFTPDLLNASQSRNIGLRAAKTRLAAVMDNDVLVRPGWLEAMIRCQVETGAAMVAPLILDAKDKIHAAGCDILITYRNGEAYGQKFQRFQKRTYWEGTNMKRVPTDYGELHCQLVVVETALKLEVFDEKLREAAEVDSGLAWAKAGCTMIFEPASVVEYLIPRRITFPEDIRSFIFKWDADEIRKGYDHFKKKWDLDITECGAWGPFNAMINNQLGMASRLFPSKLGIAIDNTYYRLRKSLKGPGALWRNYKAKLSGVDRWAKMPQSPK